MSTIDVFLCYRRYGAQTAKLFKKYLLTHNFPGGVWYSDSEVQGNYKDDIPKLIRDAECAVLFIDPDFTHNFLENRGPVECITAREIAEIGRRLLSDQDFKIVTVFLDRISGFRQDEAAVLSSLFQREEIERPEEATRLLCQSNAVFFSTATDDEDDLFGGIARDMLPGEYYKDHMANGNFYFGIRPTHVDIVLWDSRFGIHAENVFFEITAEKPSLYSRIERYRTDLPFEAQNNQMISFVGANAILSDEEEKKIISIRYQKIDYHLFYKALMLWDQFELSREISTFDWQNGKAYPVPNAMGLAFMVITSDQQLIFSRRSSKRRVRPLQYDCSIVEGLKLSGLRADGSTYEISDEDFLVQEVKRAFCEEICDDGETLDVQINGLVLDKDYGQWNLVGTILTTFSAEEIVSLHALRDDTFEENELLYVPLIDSAGVLCLHQLECRLRTFLHEGMWDMALAPVYSALMRIGFNYREINEMARAL